MDRKMIVLAGATGKLGQLVAAELRRRDVNVRAIVRPGTSSERLAKLRQQGIEIVEADIHARAEVARACKGATCVVSTLLGLHSVMVGAQTALLEAAIEAGVPRFIPSDYAMDFMKIAPGMNRNFDLHREFYLKLDQAPIRATSILMGAFMELLTGEAPLILFKARRVLYWGDNVAQPMDSTTMADTAAFTAEAALDDAAPRVLRVAGEKITASGLAKVASECTGKSFKTLHGGSLNRLRGIIKVTRALTPNSDAPFPVWQGMQYLHCMFEGTGELQPLDNGRYPNLQWTGVRTVLS